MAETEFDANAFDDFLRTDPSVQYVLQNAAAEKRLRERDNLPKHLDAVVVGYGEFRWIKIIDDKGTSHIEQVSP